MQLLHYKQYMINIPALYWTYSHRQIFLEFHHIFQMCFLRMVDHIFCLQLFRTDRMSASCTPQKQFIPEWTPANFITGSESFCRIEDIFATVILSSCHCLSGKTDSSSLLLRHPKYPGNWQTTRQYLDKANNLLRNA